MIDVQALAKNQRQFFRNGATLDLDWRKEQLRKLLAAVKKFEQPLYDALWQDLRKSMAEAYLCEISIVTGEIREALSHLHKWAAPRRKATPIHLFPAKSHIISEPLGSTLIIAPWNYPVTLLLCPLVGAISAGCTALLKPSPYVPNVSRVVQELIEDTFPSEYIAVVQGHRDVNEALLALRWDLIFFTGSPSMGKVVMKAAAENLCPVVLELGGKSPCIVNNDANIKLAAKRIAWGKTLNSGQTCIAPDYLLLHKDIVQQFIGEFSSAVRELHGSDVKESGHYVRMVSDKAYNRVKSYLKDGKIVSGGRFDDAERYIEPTLLADAALDAPVMTEEIFGPILPIISFSTLKEAQDFVNAREKPLALYYFGSERDGRAFIRHTSSGGACINDVIMHFANKNIPFGGVGTSGMGRYHGEESFKAFSHKRSVLSTSTRLDLPFRYMPYKAIDLVKKILK
ncbi:MAG: aldehyde dehydrogenase [Candidatus Cryptobacteroides sp.]|jgi:aldehyde dehydrogenase (NAD+)|nr:aldehyde dehydrogenase [Rikenellaceae bacterium]